MHEVEGISPFCIKLPQIIGYTKYVNDNNKYINSLANDKELLKKHNGICDKMKSLSKKRF